MDVTGTNPDQPQPPQNPVTPPANFYGQNPADLIRPQPAPELSGGDYAQAVKDYKIQQELKPKETFSTIWGRAVDQDSVAKELLTVGHDFPYDPDFAVSQQLVDKMSQGLTEGAKKLLPSANSLEHMESIRASDLHQQENEVSLEAAGGRGIAARVGVAFTDPVQLLATAGTGFVGGGLYRATMLTRMAAMGLLEGASQASIEAYLSSRQTARDPSYIGVAGGLGFALGTVGGAFTRGEQAALRKAGHNIADDLQLLDVHLHGADSGLTVKPDKVPGEQYDPLDELKGLQLNEMQKIMLKAAQDKNDPAVLADFINKVKGVHKEQADNAATMKAASEAEKQATIDKAWETHKAEQSTIGTYNPEAEAAMKDRFTEDFWTKHSQIEAAWGDYEKAQKVIQEEHDVIGESDIRTLLEADDSGVPWDHYTARGLSADAVGGAVEMDHPANFLKVGIPGTSWEIPIRFDLFAILARQQNPVFRWMNDVIHPNATGGGYSGANAIEYAQMVHQQHIGNFQVTMREAFDKYALDNPTPWVNKSKLNKEFNQLVTAARRDPDMRVHPAVRQAANEMGRLQKSLVDTAKKHLVDGADDFEAAHNYVNRQFSNDSRLMKLAELEGKLGSQSNAINFIIEGLAHAIAAPRSITIEKATTIAKAYYKTVSALQYSGKMKGGLNGDKHYGLLREALKELNIPAGDIEAVLELLTGRPHNAEDAAKGIIPRFKPRTLLDETYVHTHPNGASFRVTDLFENDAEKLMHSYSKQLSGAIGLAKVGIKSQADWEKLIAKADEWGVLHSDPNVHKLHSKYMQDSFKTLLGIPLEDNPHAWSNRILRVVRDWNFTTNMGQAGFAQMPDLGNLIGTVGLRTFNQHMPAFRELLKTLKGGQIPDQLQRDIQRMYGVGTDMLNHFEITPLSEVPYSKGITAAENAANVGKWATSRLSGMASINNFLHQVSFRMVMSHIIDHALGVSKLSEVQLAKMATAGLSKGDLTELAKLLPKFTSRDSKGVLQGINYEDMFAHNHELADKFKLAVHRESRRAVQMQLRGENHPWMHTAVGQLLFQFRSFVMAAFPKQLLYGLSHMDRHTIMAWGLSSMMAALSYTAQNAINYAGNDKELEKRLAWKEIAKAAYSRAGYSSIIPSMIDTATDWTTGEPIWKYSRSSGNETNFFTGNPTYAKLSAGYNALKHISRAALDDEYEATRSEVKGGLQTVLPNYLLLRNFINSVSSEYPAKNPFTQPTE